MCGGTPATPWASSEHPSATLDRHSLHSLSLMCPNRAVGAAMPGMSWRRCRRRASRTSGSWLDSTTSRADGRGRAGRGRGVDPYTNQVIERIVIRIVNPSADAGLNARVEDQVRDASGRSSRASGSRRNGSPSSFPRRGASGTSRGRRLRHLLRRARRARHHGGRHAGRRAGRGPRARLRGRVSRCSTRRTAPTSAPGSTSSGSTTPTTTPGSGGRTRCSPATRSSKARPAGAGYDQWVEGYAHYGIYGITPVTPNLYVYGGLSAITSGSAGQELFTDETRTYTGVEDAYVGVVGGRTDAAGNRLAYNLSVGRQRFTLANGFLSPTRPPTGRSVRRSRPTRAGPRTSSRSRRSATTTRSSSSSTSTPTSCRSSTPRRSMWVPTSRCSRSTG
jgi:hypothetical protein